MKVIEHALLQHLFMGITIEENWARRNFDEVSRFVDYYELPLHLWQCLNKDESYTRLLVENQQVITRFTGEIDRITSVLMKHGIDYCILVGIPFAMRFFPLPDIRLQEDIDFFIRATDFEKVMVLMSEIGYITFGKMPSKDQKHQTFINEGFQKKSTSFSGRNVVKFYLSLSLKKYFPTQFEEFADDIILYDKYPVLNDTATLIHLILHAHLYDLHPKVLADIYMVCQNGTIDWKYFWARIHQLKAAFLSAILLKMMQDAFQVENIVLPELLVTPAVLELSQKFAASKWWQERHPGLSPEKLTEIRSYLTGDPDYHMIFDRDVQSDLCRRVGSLTEKFNFKGM